MYLRDEVSQRVGRDGGEISASTLRQYVSALSSCFCKLGRDTPWNELTRTGNPVLSQLVRSHVDMAARRQHANGHREQSAVPVPEHAIRALLCYIDHAAAAAAAGGTPLERLRLARDAAALALLWQSSRRGADLLRMRWDHVGVQGSVCDVTQLWVSSTPGPPCGTTLLITLDEVKNDKRSRPATIVVAPESDERVTMCAVRRLHHLLRLQRVLDGHESTHVFCSYQRVDPPRRPLTSSGFANQFASLIRAAQLSQPAGAYTVHGIRRGRIQHAHAQGATMQDLMRLAGIRTEGIVELYLDAGRHLA